MKKNKLLILKNVKFNFRLTEEQVAYMYKKMGLLEHANSGVFFAQVWIYSKSSGEVSGKFIPAHTVDKMRPFVKRHLNSAVVLKYPPKKGNKK